MEFRERDFDKDIYNDLISKGFNPALSNIFSARNIKSSDDIEYQLDKLLAPNLLKSNIDVGKFLMQAIIDKQKIIVIGDYDADGATATACCVLGLRKFGADIDFIVPNRFEFGYGLTPKIVKLAAEKSPDIIITVDNGIASIDGVEEANKLGITVVITDHHLPAKKLPNALYIVNPNQKTCTFPSKSLCGVGVIFYVLLSTRIAFRGANLFSNKAEPNLADLLDLVALGTVADLVPLDFNNRILVKFGLDKINSKSCNFGIRAILSLNKNTKYIKSTDLSFTIAPKLNAAGRLDDMTLGIQCLLSDSMDSANNLAKKLNLFNEKRKVIEEEMKEKALLTLSEPNIKHSYSVTMFDPSWHQGVIGILAARIKEKYYRPTIIFAEGDADFLKGSGRSILSYHLRDAIDLISKRNPKLIHTFGGHAMAVGLTIKRENFKIFSEEFEAVSRELIQKEDLNLIIEIDKEIPSNYFNYETARAINSQIWGQGFPAPIFFGTFDVLDQKIVAEKHTKCILYNKDKYNAIFFNSIQRLPDRMSISYSVDTNEFNNKKSLQIIIKNLNDE
jgi:single-stranded-DNA-specific exonuclease